MPGRKGDRERRDRYRRPIEVTRLLWFSHYSSGRSILEAHLAAGTTSALPLLAASPALWSLVLFFLHLLRHSFLTRILIPHTKIPYVAVYVELLLSLPLHRTCISRSRYPLPPWLSDWKIIFPCAAAIVLRQLSLSLSLSPQSINSGIICPLWSLSPISTWSWMITVFSCCFGKETSGNKKEILDKVRAIKEIRYHKDAPNFILFILALRRFR